MSPPSVADLHLIELPRFVRADGAVAVLEAPLVPFTITRVFAVTAQNGAVRGRHAHRACSQFLFTPHGAIDATADDGSKTAVFRLEDGKSALHVPPGIWLELTWRTPAATLVVLCDRLFEEADYVRERDQFIAWRRGGMR